MKIKLFLCCILLLWSNIIFAQVEVLEKEVILARPYEFFSPTFGNLEMELFHNVFLVYNSNFDWNTAMDSGIFIGDYNYYDYYGFSIKYGEMIREETSKPDNSSELLINVEENHPGIHNRIEINASRYWRKNSELAFDKPAFELFKATINYMLLGEEKIWIPNFSYKGCRKRKDAFHVSFKIYAIVNVTSFEPISAKNADLWLKN